MLFKAQMQIVFASVGDWVFSGIFLVKYTSYHSKLVLLQRTEERVIHKNLQELGLEFLSVCSLHTTCRISPIQGEDIILHLCSAQDELYVCLTLYLSKNEHSLQRQNSNWVYVLVAWRVQKGNGGAELWGDFWSNGFDLVTALTPHQGCPGQHHVTQCQRDCCQPEA